MRRTLEERNMSSVSVTPYTPDSVVNLLSVRYINTA
jgi:hypothetical protein